MLSLIASLIIKASEEFRAKMFTEPQRASIPESCCKDYNSSRRVPSRHPPTTQPSNCCGRQNVVRRLMLKKSSSRTHALFKRTFRHPGSDSSEPIQAERVILANLRARLLKTQAETELRLVNKILFNEESHIVSVFKEYLIFDDTNEFVNRFYSLSESDAQMQHMLEQSSKDPRIRPWCQTLPEVRILAKGTRRKQKVSRYFRNLDSKAHDQNVHPRFFSQKFMQDMGSPKAETRDSISLTVTREEQSPAPEEMRIEDMLDRMSCSGLGSPGGRSAAGNKQDEDAIPLLVMVKDEEQQQQAKSARVLTEADRRLYLRALGSRNGKAGAGLSAAKTVGYRTVANATAKTVAHLNLHPQRKLVISKKQAAVPPPAKRRQPLALQCRLRRLLVAPTKSSEKAENKALAAKFTSALNDNIEPITGAASRSCKVHINDTARTQPSTKTYRSLRHVHGSRNCGEVASTYSSSQSLSKLHLKNAQSADLNLVSVLRSKILSQRIVDARALREYRQKSARNSCAPLPPHKPVANSARKLNI